MADQLKILLAEDSRVVRQLLQGALAGWGYDVIVAEDGEQAWRILQSPDAPSIALLDWMMPGLDGREVCQRVRQAAREPYVYIILLTGKDQQEDVVRGLQAGADDYLKKPFDSQELEARIRTGRRIVDLHRDLISAREALREQATTDSLTGLANRRTVLDTLDRELERARRGAGSCSVVFIDFDHFKAVNDTHGHATGDAVLRQKAAQMRAILRPYDVLGRFGGEEFIAVLPGCDAAGARAAAERLRGAVRSTPVTAGAVALTVTCSLGVAVGGVGSSADREALLAAADAAVYEAKRTGRDRVVMSGGDGGVKEAPREKPAAPAEPAPPRRPKRR